LLVTQEISRNSSPAALGMEVAFLVPPYLWKACCPVVTKKDTPMNTYRWWMVSRSALLASVGALLWLGTAASPAQEQKDKDKAAGQARLTSLVRAGYTRPGTPEDPLNKDGSIRPLAWDPDYQGKNYLGGTIYWIVLEQTGTDGDSWGTGVADFDEHFVEGKSY